MPSRRGAIVFGAGIGLWLAARVAGSPTLHMVAVGLVVLPFAAVLFARRSHQRLHIRRRLSDARVAPGRRVKVEIEVENESSSSTSFLLLEDRMPAALGRPARLVVGGSHRGASNRSPTRSSPNSRGRYVLGPLSIDVSDPFALTRMRLEFDAREDLVVTPEIETLEGGPASPFGIASGLSLAKHVFRTGHEFYTMRPYQQGDDLRRIHWRSVARTGELMIRQDESTRRAASVLFLDTRESALGRIHTPAFEKAVSVAASVGAFLTRQGFSLRLATSQIPPTPTTEEELMETLAGLSHSTSRALSVGLMRLRMAAAADATLIAVTSPPLRAELTALTRAGAAFGPKLAILVYPVNPDTLSPPHSAELQDRASAAHLTLSRSGWEVLLLSPSGKLRDVWHITRNTKLAVSGSSR